MSLNNVPQPDANGEFASPLDGALFMASFGIPQTPLYGKKPFLPEWQKKASIDPKQLWEWAEACKSHGGCNFGSVALPNGFFIFEADTAPDGVPSVRERFENAGGQFTSRLMVASRPDGTRGHRYYRWIPGIENIGQNATIHGDFSVRADAEQCVSPGSIHPETGKQYRLILPYGVPEPPTPQELTFWNSEKKTEENKADFADEGVIPVGQRNQTITSRLGKIHHAAGGASYETLVAAANDINQQCAVPLPDSELETIASSVSKYPVKVDEFKEQVELRAAAARQAQIASGALILAEPDAAPVKPVKDGEDKPEDAIPPFDPSVINGIYAKFVDLVCRGTTLNPQYAFAIAKTLVGIRMAGKVKFEDLDAEPRYYTALIGQTGSGKGLTWRRVYEQIFNFPGNLAGYGFRVANDFDSGAGIKDMFAPPKDATDGWENHIRPLVCFVDEVTTLGNKSKDTRNPGILDEMVTLANSTSISRSLAKKSGGGWTNSQARLCVVMCGQDGDTFMKAFAGRTDLGWYDRLYPEWGEPQEAGDTPPVDPSDAARLLSEFNSLGYSGNVKMSPEARKMLTECWDSQDKDVKKKARWRANLKMDAYMSAFGRGSRVVDPEDAEIAIKIFARQLVIRRVCFTAEVPDRVGYYLKLIKTITQKMIDQLGAGVAPELVAKSRRDYETATHAFRDNEEHIFAKAWETHSRVWLRPVTVLKTNGHKYEKLLPVIDG